ncbi:SDR family NAD(P)-dependent oxidoreductase [Rugosimonospora africana]|uniref:Short-chain dehydrogenase n=1 Tax=Rugosimonospora africana TaxID=556532 RepID=A0A8J3QRJ9_9ACTN|nr:SDR family NAD(P)-dependent oxidoreductase [Rugosimonospora africana]GIH16170.1 short-chain dehydrogenase [Rugosimonospora africana]
MRGLRGRRVLVSGGSSGIGEAAARRFLEEGARVFIGGLDPGEVAAALARLAEVGGVTDTAADLAGTAADVSDEAEAGRLVRDAAAALGGIDVLANNAGTAWREPFLDIAPHHWDRLLAVNLRGMFLVAQHTARVLVAQGTGGSIVNMSSINGLAGEADYAHYNASKAAVLGLTTTMAVELGRYGIRVNALCPGYIETPLNAQIASDLDDGFAAGYAEQKIPLRRTGRPDEVAAAYAFLASDDASFITGTAIVVDGGQLTAM